MCPKRTKGFMSGAMSICYMTEPIADKLRQKIKELWVAGLTYREIQEETGVSLSTISDIINKEKGEEPDLEIFGTLTCF